MRKTFKTLALVAVAAMTLIGCQKESAPQTRNAEGLYKYTFNVVDGEAKIDADTKATIGEGNIEWVSGDQVGVFIGSTPNYAKMDITTTPVKAVLYSSTAIAAGTKVYGYYPYLSSNETASNATIHFASVQQGAESSAMPLAGVPFDVEDEIDPKAQSGNGELKFLNLGSLVVFKIWSADANEQAETIQYIQMESNETVLAGDATINLTAVNAATPSTLAVTFGDNAESVVKVNQAAQVASSKDGATAIKMVVAPGTFSSTLKICTDAHTYYFNLAEKTYNRSGMRTFGVNLANAVSKEGVDLDAIKLPYVESFATDQGSFTIDNVVAVPSGLSAVWTHSNQNGSYMKATAYENGSRYVTESMLVSPWINLVDIEAATVSFDHAHRYVGSGYNVNNYLTFWVKTDASGADWIKLDIPSYGSGSNWTMVNSGDIDLTAYCGHNVKVAFKYTSGGTENDTPTWEINNFKVGIKKVECGIVYEKDSFELSLGSEDYNDWTAPELTNPHNLLDITYASDNETVATVSASTGEVTLKGVAGTAIITATFAGDDQYEAGSASYSIIVKDPSVTTITDVLTRATTGVTGTSYTAWSGKTSNSDAEYAGTSAGGNSSIQLRSNDNVSGIVSTVSGGYVTKVTVSWESHTQNGRVLNVYGSNSAYTSTDMLYSNDAGDLIGTIVCGTSTELTIPYDYQYIGLRSAEGAMYLSEIQITWSKTASGNEPPVVELSSIAVSGQTTTFTVGDTFAFDGTVTASYSNGTTANVTELASVSTPDLSTEGVKSVTVSYTENSITKTTSYDITVNAATPLQYTLTPASGSNNGYANNCDIDIDGITWNLTGNSTFQPWRIGGKSLTSVDRALYSKTALAKNISKIEITHGSASSITINSMTVIVATDNNFSNVVSTLTPTFAANSTVTINRPSGKVWSNCYYKIVYNVTVAGTSNKFLEFSEAKFYGTN